MGKPKKKRRGKFSQNEQLTYGFTSYLIDLFENLQLENYEIDEETNNIGNPIMHINCEQMYGMFTIGARKGFMGTILNNGKINWMQKEGFNEKELDSANIWINCEDEEEFIDLLVPRVYKKKLDGE